MTYRLLQLVEHGIQSAIGRIWKVPLARDSDFDLPNFHRKTWWDNITDNVCIKVGPKLLGCYRTEINNCPTYLSTETENYCINLAHL